MVKELNFAEMENLQGGDGVLDLIAPVTGVNADAQCAMLHLQVTAMIQSGNITGANQLLDFVQVLCG